MQEQILVCFTKGLKLRPGGKSMFTSIPKNCSDLIATLNKKGWERIVLVGNAPSLRSDYMIQMQLDYATSGLGTPSYNMNHSDTFFGVFPHSQSLDYDIRAPTNSWDGLLKRPPHFRRVDKDTRQKFLQRLKERRVVAALGPSAMTEILAVLKLEVDKHSTVLPRHTHYDDVRNTHSIRHRGIFPTIVSLA